MFSVGRWECMYIYIYMYAVHEVVESFKQTMLQNGSSIEKAKRKGNQYKVITREWKVRS